FELGAVRRRDPGLRVDGRAVLDQWAGFFHCRRAPRIGRSRSRGYSILARSGGPSNSAAGGGKSVGAGYPNNRRPGPDTTSGSMPAMKAASFETTASPEPLSYA